MLFFGCVFVWQCMLPESLLLLLISGYLLGQYVERIRKDQFRLSRANQLMGCLINKVASSSMMRMFLTLQGIDTKKIESPHGFRTKFEPEVSYKFNNAMHSGLVIMFWGYKTFFFS